MDVPDVPKESISIQAMSSVGKVVMECFIETKAGTILQFIDGLRGDVRVTSGYLSQNSLPRYFGVGDAQKVDRVEIDWPSGRKQVITLVSALTMSCR
jgi:ASPIC/UnbV protein